LQSNALIRDAVTTTYEVRGATFGPGSGSVGSAIRHAAWNAVTKILWVRSGRANDLAVWDELTKLFGFDEASTEDTLHRQSLRGFLFGVERLLGGDQKLLESYVSSEGVGPLPTSTADITLAPWKMDHVVIPTAKVAAEEEEEEPPFRRKSRAAVDLKAFDDAASLNETEDEANGMRATIAPAALLQSP
jgi:hypothetical protein